MAAFAALNKRRVQRLPICGRPVSLIDHNGVELSRAQVLPAYCHGQVKPPVRRVEEVVGLKRQARRHAVNRRRDASRMGRRSRRVERSGEAVEALTFCAGEVLHDAVHQVIRLGHGASSSGSWDWGLGT